MTRSRFPCAVAAAAALLLGAPEAGAQSDILLRPQSGSPAGDRFRVDSAGGFVALGQLGIGIIPVSGSGSRTMWYPYRGAFRAGGVNTGGTHWDDANIGFYSWAGGVDTRATQHATFAFGDGSTAAAIYGIALGAGAGAFVLNDASNTDSTLATENNQFTGRFAGGWRLFTNATRTTGVTLNAGGSAWNTVSDRSGSARWKRRSPVSAPWRRRLPR